MAFLSSLYYMLNKIMGFALFFVANCVIADESEAPILAIIDFFPFGFVLEGQKPQGMVFEIEHALEQLSGLPIDARLMSLPRALRSISVGQNDLLFSYKDDVMVPNVIWLGNLGCLVPLVVSHIDGGIKKLDDLKGKRVGYVGLAFFDSKQRQDWDLTLVKLNDNFIMLKMFLRGRIDAIIINNIVLNAFLANPHVLQELPQGWHKKLAQPLALTIYETHLSMSKSSKFQHMIPALKSAIIKGRKLGKFKRIFNQWGSKLGGHCFNRQELKVHQWLNKSN